MDTTITTLKGETGRDARRRIRAGTNLAPTSGMAPGYVQGNLAILPKALAADFARFCQLNPKPCPLLGQSEPGEDEHECDQGRILVQCVRSMAARRVRVQILVDGLERIG